MQEKFVFIGIGYDDWYSPTIIVCDGLMELLSVLIDYCRDIDEVLNMKDPVHYLLHDADMYNNSELYIKWVKVTDGKISYDVEEMAKQLKEQYEVIY